jgi:hypothetical protein
MGPATEPSCRLRRTVPQGGESGAPPARATSSKSSWVVDNVGACELDGQGEVELGVDAPRDRQRKLVTMDRQIAMRRSSSAAVSLWTVRCRI